LSAVDDDTASTIDTTAAQIRSRLAQIEEVRRDAVSAATERAARATRALSAATSDSGLYGRA
ncbi:MAG: hypothetical protein OEQ47_19135, partial [Acidimicrobiia bacterium]|nr:hypothetical protein [Acidimicrobiia bacterium]